MVKLIEQMFYNYNRNLNYNGLELLIPNEADGVFRLIANINNKTVNAWSDYSVGIENRFETTKNEIYQTIQQE